MSNMQEEYVKILIKEIIALKDAIYPLRDIEEDEELMAILREQEQRSE